MATAKKFGDNLISTLKNSVADLEEFQVQLALGKAEAHDKFEEVKKKFNGYLQSSKQKLAVGKERKEKIREVFDELQVQLALGKAESKEMFETQKKKILSGLSKLEKSVENKSAVFTGEVDEKFRHEVEKFKIKLEVLRVQFELGKLDAKDNFEERKHDLAVAVAKLKAKFADMKKSTSKTRQMHHQEVKDAYKHMKKTFGKAK